MVYFVHYKDDGPKGISVQDARTTSNWSILIQVEDWQEAYHLMRLDEITLCERLGFCGASGSQCRKNARIVEVFTDNEFESDNFINLSGKIGKYEFNNN